MIPSAFVEIDGDLSIMLHELEAHSDLLFVWFDTIEMWGDLSADEWRAVESPSVNSDPANKGTFHVSFSRQLT